MPVYTVQTATYTSTYNCRAL